MALIKHIKKPETMRRFFTGLAGITAMLAICIAPARAQDYEIKQLLLDVEKLGQLKSILSDMEQGYTVLTSGYNQVKDLSQGNFSLHEAFLNGLLSVSPEVKKYGRIADIIADEASIVSEYKTAFTRFKGSGTFNSGELNYLGKVYSRLTAQALQNLNGLMSIITTSKLRMGDGERLTAIDRIYTDTVDKLQFLRSFNRKAALLQLQKQREQNDVQALQKFYQP